MQKPQNIIFKIQKSQTKIQKHHFMRNRANIALSRITALPLFLRHTTVLKFFNK